MRYRYRDLISIPRSDMNDTDEIPISTPMRYLYRYQWDTDTDTHEMPIPIPMRYQYRYQWDTDTDTHEIPIPIPSREARSENFFRLPPRYPWDTNTDTNELPIPMRYQYRYHRAKREAKNFLDYLREPPGQANFFYTTSASLPAGRPNTTFNGAIQNI